MCEKQPLGKKLKGSLPWVGRAVGHEVGMEKIIDSIGIIEVWRPGDLETWRSRQSRQGLVLCDTSHRSWMD